MENHPKSLMQLLVSLSLSSLLICSASAAQQKLPGLQPLPPPPAFDPREEKWQQPPSTQPAALPTDDHADPVLGTEAPAITRKAIAPSVEEYRAGGKLYMIKITPKVGPPYYLIDDLGDGKFTHYEHLDPNFRPPRWVIHRF